MSNLTCAVIRCVRGRTSSSLISQKMGFKSNVVYSWETGRRKPTWSQFIRLCEATDPKIIADFKYFFKIQTPINNTGKLFKHLCGDNAQKNVVASLKLSKSTVSKLVSGQVEPSCDLIFNLISMSGGQLVAFLARHERFHHLKPVAALLRQQRLFLQFPEAIILWNLVDLEGYKLAEDGDLWLAEAMGISLTTLHLIIEKMLELELLARKDGRYFHGATAVCLIGTTDQRDQLLRFWLMKIIEQSTSQMAIARHHVFSADEQAIQEIKIASVDFLHRVGTIIEESQKRPQTDVFALVMALVNPLVSLN